MDFRAAAAALPPPAAHMAAMFTQPPALPPPPPPPPPPTQSGMFLYPGLSSPVKPPSHLLPSHKVSRNTATVPPLLQTSTPTPTSAHQASSAASQTSSFAAALKSLARNAGGTDAKEATTKSRDAPVMSPKRVPLHVPRAPHTDNPPPVVAIAPTPTHQRRESAAVTSASDITKLSPEVTSQLSAAAGADALSRAGFQPYRPDERLLESLYPGYAPSSLYPGLPRTGYPPRRPEERYLESLYPLQPVQHPLYGLEEQLYLERLGLLRPSLGVAGLSAYSPLLSAARYPPELLHSPLYMSQSLYLQERLKLEEDTRRKLETERERSREPGSQTVAPTVRERSPVRPATTTTATTSSSGAVPSELRNGTSRGRSSPAERRSASSGEQQTSPAAYRPYLSSPVQRTAAREPPLDLRTGGDAGARSNGARHGAALGKPRSHKKTTVVRPFEDTAPARHADPPADAPLNLSERGGRADATEPLTSTLDRREQLHRQGIHPDEAEPIVRHLDLLTGPPCKTVTSPEKLQFLAHVGLTTHSYRNDVELKNGSGSSASGGSTSSGGGSSGSGGSSNSQRKSGMQAVTQMYTVYNKERAAAADQARRTQERLRAQQARLEETSRGLALRLNRQVAYRSLQWRQREAIQEQLDRLGALVRALPTRARRKH
ncbi:nascent polypeptide-associated complex subunit alpha, muscle-specific form-like [Pollicipes pollicipes]|uniref:nascent polypeptide-associated complex subunit alpha, muscle-specific form-like n=1 Tax=Pollicipes pollicipes TaxID=41117 RepID=UPI00188587F9|nr:nascent polypeptide-associated complex subunit alpha, muscle-specific form-like [Pollicipes pollicipes]